MSRAAQEDRSSAGRRLLGTAWSLTWRAAVTLGVGAALMLLLGAGVLAASRNYVTVDVARSPSAGLGLAAGTLVAVLLAGAVGMTVTVHAVALLVRNHLDHRHLAHRPAAAASTGRRAHLQLRHDLGAALTATPKVLLFCFLATTVVGLLTLLAPVAMVAALVRTGWRLARREVPRRQALAGLLWVVPFAVALRAVAAAPAVYASLLNGAPLRTAVRAALRQRLRARAVVLAGMLAVTAVNVVLTQLTLTGLQGGPAFYAVLAGTLLLAGTALGALAHTPARRARGDSGDSGDSTSGVVARQQRHRRSRRQWTLRRARVAAVTTFAIVAGTVGFASPSLAAPAQTPDAIVVNDASDPTTTVDPAQCQSAGPCGLRAALAFAAQQVDATGSATVTFADSIDGQTISLAGTLQVGGGVTVDAGTNTVTLDAHHDFRALETILAGSGEGLQATLRGLQVTGGRSASGGAGLYSNAVRVTLDAVTFSDNISGAGGDGGQLNGGAVAVPYTQLTVTNSTFTDNSASAGVGGAMTAASLTLTNSTLVDNTGVAGQPEGGAVYAPSGGHVSHVTVSGSGGVAGSDAALLQVTNTLVTEPVGPWFACARITGPDDVDVPSAGNVDSAGTCLGVSADPQPLGALAGNGGPTRTMIPAPGNPALGAAAAQWCQPADQRGEPRNPSSCDAGAVQTNGDVPTVDLNLSPVSTFPSGKPLTFNATVRQQLDNSVPAGSLQMVEGGTLLGEPVQIDTSVGSYQLTVPALAQGPHTVALRFTPPGGGAPQDSAPAHLGVVVPALVAISTSAPVVVNDPATLVATITDDPGNGPGSAPGSPAPSGTATFRYNSGQSTDAPVTDGVATLHVNSLTSAAVTVIYSGDDWYDFSLADQSDVFAADVPTTTTATVDTPDVAYGQHTQIAVRIADVRGAAPGGAAHLVVDGTEMDVESLDGGVASLSAALGVGFHTGYVTFAPAAGWAGSRSGEFSFTVTLAHSSIALTYDAADPAAYPGQPHLPFTATGEAGLATVLLTDGDTVLARQQVVLPASGWFSVPDGTFDVGTRTVHAELVGTATMAGAASADVPVTIVPGASGVTMTPEFGAQVGQPVTVHVRTNGSLPATLTVTLDDGQQVTTQRLGTSADTTFTYTPTTTSTQLTAVATFDSGRYARAVSAITLTADPAGGPAPELRWENTGTDFDTTPPQLVVRYPAAVGLAAPTGSVTLRDYRGNWIGYDTLTDGTATVILRGAPGTCYCDRTAVTVTYSGDDAYRARSDTAADLSTPGRATTTRLVVHTANLLPGRPADMTVHVTAAGTTPTGRVTVAINGGVFTEGVLTDGRAEVTGWVPDGVTGPITLTASYAPETVSWNPSQVTVDATVRSYVPPTVTLTVSPAAHRIGQPEQLHAVAAVTDPFALLDTGTPLAVHDDTGALLGTGSWLSNGTAILTITPAHGGTRTLTATYGYGGGKQATSAPLTLTVRGVSAPLTVTATGPAAVGQWVGIRVALGALPDGLATGPLTVQLYDNGQKVGAEAPLFTDASGTRTATTFMVPQRKGDLYLVALSAGDGADIGYSSGAVSVPVAPATLTLHPQTGTLAPVIYGQHFTTPSVRLSGTVGGPIDGLLTATLIDSAGTRTWGCQTTLPDTRCDVFTGTLAPGTYTLAYRYSGSTRYDDVPQVLGSQFAVRPATTTIKPSFSTDPHQWVAGEKVTATFSVTDTFTATGIATGTIRLAAPSHGDLCFTGVTGGHTATCAFTVPWPDAPPRSPLGEAVTATFTPASSYSTGATAGTWLPAIARCFTATADRAYAVTFDSGVPAVAVANGRTCTTAGDTGDRAGTYAGYTEGSALTVTDDLARTGNGWKFTGITATPAGGAGYLLPGQAGSGRVTTAALTANTRFVPAFTWAPTCVTVAAGYEDLEGIGRSRAGYAQYASWRSEAVARPTNSVQLDTPSNCASPFNRMSEDERADYANGIGHYVAGTDVRVYPLTSHSYPATPAKPDWQLVSIPGTTKDANGYYHLTAQPGLYGGPAVVYGVFRWSAAMCRTVTTSAGGGGTVAITASAFPAELARMENPTGACTTGDGQRGYLAGTAVTATATPTNSLTTHRRRPAVGENYLYRWPASWLDVYHGKDPLATDEKPGRSGSIDGDPYAAHDATVVVSLTGGASFAATFAKVNCVPVTLDLTGLPAAEVHLTPGNCAAVPTDQQIDGRTVRYYEARTHVTFSADHPTKPAGWGGRTLGLRWKAVFPGGRADTFYDRSSGEFTVPADPAGVQLAGSYVDTRCRPALIGAQKVLANVGYSYVANGGGCPVGQTDGLQTWVDSAMPAAAVENGVRPEWHILTRDRSQILGGLDGSASPGLPSYPVITHSNSISYAGFLSVDLAFCRPLDGLVSASVVDAAGRALAMPGPVLRHAMHAYNTRCYDYGAPVDSFVQLELTDDAKGKWLVVGWRNNRTGQISLTDRSPQFRVGTYGEIADSWTMLVQPHCYQLRITSDRVGVTTAPNCSGHDPAAGMYNPGTVVGLSFSGAANVVHSGWHGADSRTGAQTTVTMNGNRSVQAIYDVRETSGVSTFIAVVNNVGQRFIAGMSTVATVLILEPIAGVLAAGPVFHAIADGLSALGLSGAFIDGLRNFGTVLSATSDALNSWGDCLTVWATGSEVDGVLTPSGAVAVGVGGAEFAAGKYADRLDKAAGDGLGEADLALRGVTTLRDAINLFTTNFGAYSQDPQKAWEGFSGSMQTCVEAKGEALIDAGRKLGG
ncbi:MAG TPA: choice-of-anchor Q domain-containing protein [Blastococcus sp.]